MVFVKLREVNYVLSHIRDWSVCSICELSLIRFDIALLLGQIPPNHLVAVERMSCPILRCAVFKPSQATCVSNIKKSRAHIGG